MIDVIISLIVDINNLDALKSYFKASDFFNEIHMYQ